MRWLCFAIILFTTINSSAEDINTKKVTLILKDGWLKNLSNTTLYSLEIIEPFYKYLGDLLPYQKKNISYIKTKFKVRFYIKSLAGFKEMKKEFIPYIKRKPPQFPKIKIDIKYRDCKLKVKLISKENLNYTLIEIPQDYPVNISESRKRYVFSSVAVLGQNLIAGNYAEFVIYPLKEEPLYKIPVKITFIYKGTLYEKLLFYYLKKEDLCRHQKD